MKQLPIFLNVHNRTCLVVGGGSVAARKIAQLLQCGAAITVVAPRTCERVADWRQNRQLTHVPREFQPEDVENCHLIFAATADRVVNARISALAQERGIPVNVVDCPELCSFFMPSIVDRDPVQVAVSTGGASPVLARLLRARLETFIPASYGHLANLIGRFRSRAQARIPEGNQRRRFWEQVLQGPIAELLFSGRAESAAAALETALDNEELHPPMKGEVYLVGGGPGDPDLLTFRALRLMQMADVVIHDRLVAEAILELTRKDAQRIFVGKQRDQHTVPQEAINQLLVDLASEGHRVLRLKGGDPFIFGRGGEEIESLSAAGIPFQIVPGITAASGCACYAGIPLTHRELSQACIFVTGHLKDGTIALNWDALVQPKQTIAIYMGVHGMDQICNSLIAHGMRAEMPAALIEQGTLPGQRVIVGTIASMPRQVKAANIAPPSLLIVGEVVRLREKLAWFDRAR